MWREAPGPPSLLLLQRGGGVGQLTLAEPEPEPGVGRESEERRARAVGKPARSGMGLGGQVWPPGCQGRHWERRRGTGF